MLEQLRKHDWASRVHSETMDAQDLKYPDDKFTHSFTNFALMIMPEPLKAVKHNISIAHSSLEELPPLRRGSDWITWSSSTMPRGK
jgi:hypothetical protein